MELWLLVTVVAQIEQFTLKFCMEAFIPDQYMESLAQAFMPFIPWWAEWKQRSTFLLRDLDTTILPFIHIRPLSVLSQCCTPEKLRMSGSVRELLEGNPWLIEFIRVM